MVRENLALNGGIVFGFIIGQAVGVNAPITFVVAFMGVMNAYFVVNKLINWKVRR